MIDWHPNGWIWIEKLAFGWARSDENPHRPDDCSNLPIFDFGKKIWSLVEHWVSSGRAAETSGQMQAGAVWSFSTQRKVQTGIHVVRTDDAMKTLAENPHRPDGMTCRPDGWQGTEFSGSTLNSGIPVKKHHYKEVILSNRMRPIYKLTNSHFGLSWTKIT